MKLFISPSEATGKITEKNLFINLLKSRWETVVIEEINDINRRFVIEWNIDISNKYLSGKLSREEDMIVFDFSDLELGAEFAIWVFNNLLRKTKIILYDDSYSTILDLNIRSNTRDIIRDFS